MGQPNLYHLSLNFVADADTLACHDMAFGVRQVDATIDRQGHRAFLLNGRPVLIRGAGWVDDIFMRNTPDDYTHQLSLVKDMGLNTLRFEGFWGTSDHIFNLCDSLGIMLMVGLKFVNGNGTITYTPVYRTTTAHCQTHPPCNNLSLSHYATRCSICAIIHLSSAG